MLILLGLIFVNHQIRLLMEDKQFIPMGDLVSVNGQMMHVYTVGEGEIPLVFMARGGTSSPVLDFKSLYDSLSDSYQVVVVEKFGYGFSEVTDAKRDIESILSDTREALVKANILGPYILFPHSMSGIEALYWAQTYPSEILGIVGLDMAIPKAYENYEINLPLIKLGAIASKLGITRLIPYISESDAIKYGTLSEAEKELYKVVFYRRTATKTMINEVLEIKQNAMKINRSLLVYLPMLMFVSNGKGTGWDVEEWRIFQENFIQDLENKKLEYLDCPHYVHDYEYEKIAQISREFIDELTQTKH